MQIERVIGRSGPSVGFKPTVLAQSKMADARLGGKFAGVFQPMIEPAQQDGVGIQQCVRAEVRGAGAIAPGNVYPRAGNQVLVFTAERRAGTFCEREKAVDAALEIRCRTSRRYAARAHEYD